MKRGAKDMHVVRALLAEPWAILPGKLEQIAAVVRLHSAGVKLTAEEIQTRVGAAPPRPSARTAGAVAVLPIVGALLPRASPLAETSGVSSTAKLHKTFRALADDPAVKAIVLEFDSPGGSVFGIQEFGDEIRAAREKKHVVAVANAMAASAAYWLASQASELVVTPSGEVGSVGALMVHADFSKQLEADGVKVTMVHAGKYKVEGNPYEPLGDEALAHFQGQVDTYLDRFVKAVAAGRGVKASDVRKNYGEGRMLLAEDALAAGMVDRIATLDQVLAKLGVGVAPASGARAELQAEPVAEDKPGGWDPVELRRKRFGLLKRG